MATSSYVTVATERRDFLYLTTGAPLGFLFQWPTLLTLVMFPVLVWMYVHLARQEERETIATFGDAYVRYAARVPAFIPRLGSSSEESASGEP